jgi:hypothetical protein
LTATAFTTEDLSKPAVNTPPSRRVLSPEQVAYQLDQLENSEFKLSPVGEARRKELSDQLAEASMAIAVNKRELLHTINTTGPEIEALFTEAVEHLEAYVSAREALLEKRRVFEAAWVAARNAKIDVLPRPRLAPPVALQHRATRIQNIPWYA